MYIQRSQENQLKLVKTIYLKPINNQTLPNNYNLNLLGSNAKDSSYLNCKTETTNMPQTSFKYPLSISLVQKPKVTRL